MRLKQITAITMASLMLAACGQSSTQPATTAAESAAPAETTAIEISVPSQEETQPALIEAPETVAEETEAIESEAATEAESKEAVQEGPVQGEGIVGYYVMTNMMENGEQSAEMEEMKNLGLNFYLVLNEDGKGYLEIFGEKEELTYDAENFYQEETDPAPYKFENGVLTFGDESMSMEFTKMSEEDAKNYVENGGGSDLEALINAMGGMESEGESTEAAENAEGTEASAEESAEAQSAEETSAEAESTETTK